MRITSFRVENFRRLKNVRVALDAESTIFVGANNSGKTSATHVFQRFLEPKSRFQIYDFTADCWEVFNRFDPTHSDPATDLPTIRFDLWFEVDDDNVHRVLDLLPGLDWEGELVGVRMVYAPRDPEALVARFLAARESVMEHEGVPGTSLKPWPQTLTEYLGRHLTNEYEIEYFILDARCCDAQGVPDQGYEPFSIGTKSSGAGDAVSGLLKVDFLNAQRHLADSDSRGRAEDLSRRLARYYQRNLDKYEADFAALNAIADSEAALNHHLAKVFESILETIGKLGYPGGGNPGLIVKASFDAHSMMNTSARVHYAIPAMDASSPPASTATLPDQYNGLGFKNLIYMAVEILDFHLAWAGAEGVRPSVHLVMIEEPEAHLHAQLQQVFIRKVFDLLPEAEPAFHTQMVVTTHSSHILYERSYQPIRYFCRSAMPGSVQTSDVKDLSIFYRGQEKESREFLRKYLKLTHCDLFFADAAVLVEGNVERLLLPLIIERDVPELKTVHLTILEVGGAFAHTFHELLEFLHITTLVITDLDSVHPQTKGEAEDKDSKKSCMTTVPDAVTSNESLRKWFEKHSTISDLLVFPDVDKVIKFEGELVGGLRVAYQTRVPVQWAGESVDVAGRTLEEAFALENIAWTQDKSKRALGLYVQVDPAAPFHQLHEKIFRRVRGLDKTAFALNLLTEQDEWTTPRYILDGLTWLRERLQSVGAGAMDVPEEMPTLQEIAE
ncbi:ATP-dependent nuclease [Nocardia salmonicida]|uniref:ATP-dependent nuclease n=1 Tax=Nocardia salmonicida TaxID=53431 RepID=UPI003CF0BC8B